MEINWTLILTTLLAVKVSAFSRLCHEGGGCICTELTVNCSSINITSFPIDLPKNITEIVITNANIHVLRNIPEYKSLTTLRITHSHIRYIESGAFKNVPKLEHLVLNDNELTALYGNTFDGLQSIKILSLESNPIHVLKNGSFKGETTPNLEFLQLSHCEIYNIEPDAFKQLINLKELYIASNKLHSVPSIGKIIGNVEMLELFDISGNQISQIEKDPFTQLGRLKTLSLQQNHIHFLSKIAFSGLVKLVTLNLRQNDIRIHHIDTFRDLPSLHDLDLSYNKLRTLTRKDLPEALTKLHLHHNDWLCDCQLSWMLTDPIVNNTNSDITFRCKNPKALAEKNVLSLTQQDLCPNHEQSRVKLSVVLGVVLFILIGGVIMYITCRIYRKSQRKRRQQLSVPYSQVNH